MLGARHYYKEDQSTILNLFECSSERNSSHFTTLRLLELLLSHRAESTPEGRGYVDVRRVVSSFEDVFDNRADVLFCMNRLVRRQLIEPNTRSTQTSTGATHIRVTSSGWYYARYLLFAFSYLDLVLQDTPVRHQRVALTLKDSVAAVDNMADREDEKLHRLAARFKRVDRFLEYLKDEEQAERAQFRLKANSPLFSAEIVPKMRTEFGRERDWIERRVRENRERYAEELEESKISPEDSMLPPLEEALEGPESEHD